MPIPQNELSRMYASLIVARADVVTALTRIGSAQQTDRIMERPVSDNFDTAEIRLREASEYISMAMESLKVEMK